MDACSQDLVMTETMSLGCDREVHCLHAVIVDDMLVGWSELIKVS